MGAVPALIVPTRLMSADVTSSVLSVVLMAAPVPTVNVPV